MPLPGAAMLGDRVDMRVLAERLGMPVVHDEAHSLFAIGPESGGRVLESAACPDIRLPDLDGREFAFSSLRGRKVVMVAWASW